MADIDIVNVDKDAILDRELTTIEDYAGEALYPGDERRIFAESESAVHVQLLNVMNQAAKETMLKYARREVLDALGERLGVERLEPAYAKTILRFSVQTPIDQDIFIPRYTKAKTSDDVYFATTEACTITAGSYWAEAEATASTPGSAYNNFTAGSVNTMVDLIGYVSEVSNMTVTSGGDDGEPYTDVGDDRFRERIRLAPYKLSVAGPKDAYIYWAKSADADIADVKAVSEYETIHKTCPVIDGRLFIGGSHLEPDTLTVYLNDEVSTDYDKEYSDDLLTISLGDSFKDEKTVYVEMQRTLEGHVRIVPLMKNGKLSGQDVKDKILETVNAQNIRPMTDYVTVVDPHVVTYDIELEYYTTPDTESDIVDAVEGENGAIDEYNEWQTASIGRDINPDTLRQFILTKAWETGSVSGAVRIEITSPTFRALEDTEVAQFSGNLKVTHQNMLGVI